MSKSARKRQRRNIKRISLVAAIATLSLLNSAHAKTYNCSAGGYSETCSQKPPSDYKFWVKMAQCESPGNGKWGVNWKYRSKTQEGAFRFHPSTWDTWRKNSYPRSADKANWIQQMYVARGISEYNAGWDCSRR